MSVPRTFLTRQALIAIGRPLSAPEIAPLIGSTSRQAHGAIECLIRAELARRVIVAGRPRYEAVCA